MTASGKRRVSIVDNRPPQRSENQIAVVPKPSSAVVVRSAHKAYGQTVVLKDLNLTVPIGKM